MEWQESAPNAEYRVVKVVDEYRVFRLNILIGGGLTLAQAKEIIAEDIEDRDNS